MREALKQLLIIIYDRTHLAQINKITARIGLT